MGHGVRPVATQKIFTHGTSKPTENPLDIAIEGDGFFQILLPDGTMAYTRDGAFKKDGEGRLVTSDGFFLEPEIVIPEDAVEISDRHRRHGGGEAGGRIGAADHRPNRVGSLYQPGRFAEHRAQLYMATAASGVPIVGTAGMDGLGNLAQGFLEMSNVQVVEEMVNMITSQRAYEVNSQAIQAADEMLQTANNLRR